MSVGTTSENNGAVSSPDNPAPIASMPTPITDGKKWPEPASENDGYTVAIRMTHVVNTVFLRPTRSEYKPASGHSAAANSNAITVISSDVARFNPPATC